MDDQGVNLSTAWYRYYADAHLCPASKTPCFVYATLPENALNEVFINFHVNLESCKDGLCFPTFEYREGVPSSRFEAFSDAMTARAVRTEYRSPDSESTKRHIFTVLLKDLKPNTVYSFRVLESNWDSRRAQVYTYKTFNVNNMTIINGGDIGNNDLATQMIENVVGKVDADLMMSGGDTAYDQNSPSCFRAWDYLMRRLPLSKLDPATGTIRVIPMMFSTGNHDLGMSTYDGNVLRLNTHEPVFMHYYPQNTENGDVPRLHARKPYFSQGKGGQILFLNLDVGYAGPMDGEQAEFIERTLSQSTAKVKIAQYHGPIYTACKQNSEFDAKAIEFGLKHWIPLFDKYNMTVVFENHTHAFKRTKRVKYGKVHPEGTTYLGEGAWGTVKSEGDCNYVNVEIHEKVLTVTNAWIVHIDASKGVTAKAYKNDGEEIDSVFIPVE